MEPYEEKSYIKQMTLPQCRIRMRLRSQVFKSIKMNFQSDPKFTSLNWYCSCGSIQSQIHVEKHCVLYEDIRSTLNLEDEIELVKFFDLVMKRCQEEDDDKAE